MKNSNSKFTSLTRKELSKLFGGRRIPVASLSPVSDATADCGEGVTVTCSGTYSCTATDYVGCSCDDGSDAKICEYA